MPYPELKKYLSEISRCALCAGCHAQCPTYKATLDESMSARGKLGLIEALLDGRLQLSEKFAEKMFTCLSCHGCASACPSGVDPARIINAARSDIAARGKTGRMLRFFPRHILPYNRRLRGVARAAGFCIKNFPSLIPFLKAGGTPPPFPGHHGRRKLPDISGRFLRDRYPESVKPENPSMRVLFFHGCMGDMVYQGEASQVIDFLVKSGIEVLLPKGMVCCGAPQYYSGERDAATASARKNLKIIKDLSPDAVIYNCATCGYMLKGIYKDLAPEEWAGLPSEKLMDIHLFLLKKVGPPVSFHRGRKIRVTYHDPCHLIRGQGVRSEPRELLNSIPWVEYVEMKGADLCCGGAGIFSLKYYDLALEIAAGKVAAIRETGAEVVATGCPSCQAHLSDALCRAGLDIPVVHTSQLLLRGQPPPG